VFPGKLGVIGENLLSPTAFQAQFTDPPSDPYADVGCHTSRMGVGLWSDVKHASHGEHDMELLLESFPHGLHLKITIHNERNTPQEICACDLHMQIASVS
jgi:hypothetical protein